MASKSQHLPCGAHIVNCEVVEYWHEPALRYAGSEPEWVIKALEEQRPSEFSGRCALSGRKITRGYIVSTENDHYYAVSDAAINGAGAGRLVFAGAQVKAYYNKFMAIRINALRRERLEESERQKYGGFTRAEILDEADALRAEALMSSARPVAKALESKHSLFLQEMRRCLTIGRRPFSGQIEAIERVLTEMLGSREKSASLIAPYKAVLNAPWEDFEHKALESLKAKRELQREAA